jgi:hypothetical protein
VPSRRFGALVPLLMVAPHADADFEHDRSAAAAKSAKAV